MCIDVVYMVKRSWDLWANICSHLRIVYRKDSPLYDTTSTLHRCWRAGKIPPQAGVPTVELRVAVTIGKRDRDSTQLRSEALWFALTPGPTNAQQDLCITMR